MQPGAGEAAPALEPEGDQPAGQHRAQEQQDDEIDQQQDESRGSLALDRPEAPGQHAIGRKSGSDGGGQQRDGKLALQPDPACPIQLTAHDLHRPIRQSHTHDRSATRVPAACGRNTTV